MIELGKYAGTVLAAWAITLLLIGGLVAQSLAAAARARRALDEAEKRIEVRRG